MAAPGSDQSSDDSRADRAGRVLVDIQDRMARGEAVSVSAVIADHPSLADDVRECLGALAALRDARVGGSDGRVVDAAEVHAAYPQRIGPYEVVGLLGLGSMGVVLKAHDQKLRRPVALKLLRRELVVDKLSRERFDREARAAAALRHPNIVTIYAVGEAKGVPYIAMEQVDGPSLRDLIRTRGRLHAADIRMLFGQLLSGLGAAHRAGRVHRDIKPANLLLTAPIEDGGSQAGGNGDAPPASSVLLKIADFGLARVREGEPELTLAQAIVGTPSYMSPEQARGEPLDARSDLCSAGAVLYEMLTGGPPFSGLTSDIVIHRILHEDPPAARNVAPDADAHLSRLALRLMSRLPEDRFASAEEALAALRNGSVSLPWLLRSHRRKALLGIGSAAVAASIGWRLWGRRPIVRTESAEVQVRIKDAQAKDGQVQVRYGNEATWRIWEPKLNGGPGVATAAAVLDLDGRGTQAVAVTFNEMPGGTGLMIFDHDGRLRDKIDLAPTNPAIEWPDCKVHDAWRGSHILAVDVHLGDGQELLVVGHLRGDYPTRISIVDPRRAEIRSTIWHWGNLLQDVQIDRDYFEDGRPVLRAVAINNGLGGIPGQRPGKRPMSVAAWPSVTAVMLIDLCRLKDGEEWLAPPHSTCVEIQPGGVHAYAFLDCAWDDKEKHSQDGSKYMAAPPEDQARIHKIEQLAKEARIDSAWFEVTCSEGSTDRVGCPMQVDRELNFVSVRRNENVDKEQCAHYWREKWKPLIPGEKDRRTVVVS